MFGGAHPVGPFARRARTRVVLGVFAKETHERRAPGVFRRNGGQATTGE
jgi:hypothetical protein